MFSSSMMNRCPSAATSYDFGDNSVLSDLGVGRYGFVQFVIKKTDSFIRQVRMFQHLSEAGKLSVKEAANRNRNATAIMPTILELISGQAILLVELDL
jgi:hypothetical protein